MRRTAAAAFLSRGTWGHVLRASCGLQTNSRQGVLANCRLLLQRFNERLWLPDLRGTEANGAYGVAVPPGINLSIVAVLAPPPTVPYRLSHFAPSPQPSLQSATG
ncbi:hypothetical protein BDV12DRAFT_33039 [Aspergillus spectabilis]